MATKHAGGGGGGGGGAWQVPPTHSNPSQQPAAHDSPLSAHGGGGVAQTPPIHSVFGQQGMVAEQIELEGRHVTSGSGSWQKPLRHCKPSQQGVSHGRSRVEHAGGGGGGGGGGGTAVVTTVVVVVVVVVSVTVTVEVAAVAVTDVVVGAALTQEHALETRAGDCPWAQVAAGPVLGTGLVGAGARGSSGLGRARRRKAPVTTIVVVADSVTV